MSQKLIHRRRFIESSAIAAGGLLVPDSIIAELPVSRKSRSYRIPTQSDEHLPFFFGDWSMQDFTGKPRPLTEVMTLGAIEQFMKWRDKYDFGPEFYVIDVMWFDRDGDYTRWNPEAFRDGPTRTLTAMQKAGLKLGLWFDVSNGWVPRNPEWHDSYNPELKRYCLTTGHFLKGLRKAWDYNYRTYGLRVIKIDFADFTVPPPGKGPSPASTLASIKGFRKMLREFKATHDGVTFLLYNGFSYDYTGIEETLQPPQSQIVSTEWLSVADWLYSGDPRPCDWPSLRLRRSIDFYQDHQVRRFHWAGISLARIDDHGCFVGEGGSYYELGRVDWRATWILTLLRGSRKAHLYGDPSLLADDDVRWMKATYERVRGLYARGAQVEVLGGFPGLGEAYGYRLTHDGDGVAVLANPAWHKVTFRVRLEDNIEPVVCVLAADGGTDPPVNQGAGFVDVEIGPSQIVLLAFGEEARIALPSKELTPGPWPRELVATKVERMEGRVEYERRYQTAPLPRGSTLYWVVRFTDGQKRVRWNFGEKLLKEQLQIEAEGGKTIDIVPDRPLWSGISWAVITQVEVEGNAKLKIATNQIVKDFEVEAYESQ